VKTGGERPPVRVERARNNRGNEDLGKEIHRIRLGGKNNRGKTRRKTKEGRKEGIRGGGGKVAKPNVRYERGKKNSNKNLGERTPIMEKCGRRSSSKEDEGGQRKGSGKKRRYLAL